MCLHCINDYSYYCPDASQQQREWPHHPTLDHIPQLAERGANLHCGERQLLEIWHYYHYYYYYYYYNRSDPRSITELAEQSAPRTVEVTVASKSNFACWVDFGR